jgi:hypothetical protein
MSAAAALKAARDAGIELGIDGDDLLLEAVSEPPAATLEALSRHKAEIVELLRPNMGGWSAEDWRLYFEERAAVAEFDGGMSRAKPEVQAFECCAIKWLDLNPTPSAAGHCAWCGRSESQAPVPFGTPENHTWLHRQCWTEWQKMRRFQGKEALTRMGIRNLDCIVPGECSRPSNEHQQQSRGTR